MVTLSSSVSVGTICFTRNRSRTDFLAIFGYLLEGICKKPYELSVSVLICFVFSSLRNPLYRGVDSIPSFGNRFVHIGSTTYVDRFFVSNVVDKICT
jgi:hypothetical protein